jgi:hypothetical protein
MHPAPSWFALFCFAMGVGIILPVLLAGALLGNGRRGAIVSGSMVAGATP